MTSFSNSGDKRLQWLEKVFKNGTDRTEIYNNGIKLGLNEDWLKDQLKLPKYPNPIYIHFPKPLLHANRLGDNRSFLYVVDNLLSPALCNQIIENSNGLFRPSTITVDNGDKYFRTSQTYDFNNTVFNNMIDQHIYDLMNIPKEYSESTQVQFYQKGNSFKEHHDWFNPDVNSYEWKTYCQQGNLGRGQRTWTVTVYLNDTFEGGTTDFTRLNIKAEPKQGRAIIWNNLYKNGQVNHDTLHTGTPVTNGEKYIITKWFRDERQY